MAKFDYAKARAVAKNLIEKFGGVGSFTLSGASAGTDRYGEPLPAQPNVIINGTVTPLLSYKQHEIDNDRILATDSYVFFYSDEIPAVDSITTINGKDFIVKDIVKLSSVDGVNVYTKLQLRG